MEWLRDDSKITWDNLLVLERLHLRWYFLE